jgi:hypothetical protein
VELILGEAMLCSSEAGSSSWFSLLFMEMSSSSGLCRVAALGARLDCDGRVPPPNPLYRSAPKAVHSSSPVNDAPALHCSLQETHTVRCTGPTGCSCHRLPAVAP